MERHGERIVYTDDITFSSSSLLNQHFNVFEPEVQAFLDSIRRSDGLSRALAAIEDISEMRVLLIGEAIIDEYLYAEAMGKAAKENIIASRFCGREVFAGGVIAAANHVAGFCKHVEVITCLGTRDTFESLIREGLKPNDSRDRLATEFAALSYLMENGIACVPRPIAADREADIALYEWVEGVPVRRPRGEDIDRAADLIKRIMELGRGTERARFEPASAACLSGAALVEQIEARLARLLDVADTEVALERLRRG